MAIRNTRRFWMHTLWLGALGLLSGCAPAPVPLAPMHPHAPQPPLEPATATLWWRAAGFLVLGFLGGVVAALIVAAVFAAFAHRSDKAQPPTTPPSPPTSSPPADTLPPEEILKMRYARGEIDRETYLQMLRDLQTPPQP